MAKPASEDGLDERYHDVCRILDGETAACRRFVGYDFAGAHLAVIAWEAKAERRLEAMATRCGRRLLAVHCPDGTVWAWLGGGSLSTKAVDELVRWQRAQGGGAVFGEPSHGVEGWRRSHEQAVEAHWVARESGEKSVRFDAVALVALAARDRKHAAKFVEYELGPLLAAGPRAEDLIETLRVFLEHGQTPEKASRIRGVHRSTVRRHIAGAEELLGRRLEEHSAELILALRLRRLLRHRPIP